MSFISDKLYNGYLRSNMPAIVDNLNARRMVIHLPCLTSYDREIIEARIEQHGNSNGMVLLLECLKRREKWPEQFIEALEACEQGTMAREIRAEYDTLRGVQRKSVSDAPVHDVNPGSPPARDIRHPASALHPVSLTESGDKIRVAAAAAAAAAAPPQPAVKTPSLLETRKESEIPQSSAVQVPKPPQSTIAEVRPPKSTPPPSPTTPHLQVAAAPTEEREMFAHQDPEENSEPDIQSFSRDLIPDRGRNSVNFSAAPLPSGPINQSDLESQIQPNLPPASTVQSLASTLVDHDELCQPSASTLTPEKLPVQDTEPPQEKVFEVMGQPEEISGPPVVTVARSTLHAGDGATSAPPPADQLSRSLGDEASVCFSKPGQLISIPAAEPESPTIGVAQMPAEPYSGDSGRLEISVLAPERVQSCCANTARTPSGQVNGLPFYANQPEENDYESVGQSFQEVMVSVGHVAEEPSVLNMDGQTSESAAQRDARDATGGTAAENSLCPERPRAADRAELDTPCHSVKMASCILGAYSRYILVASGVAACALMVWRLKNRV